MNKKISVGCVALALVVACGLFLNYAVNNRQNDNQAQYNEGKVNEDYVTDRQNVPPESSEVLKVEIPSEAQSEIQQETIETDRGVQPNVEVKEFDCSYSNVPLSGIAELSSVSPEVLSSAKRVINNSQTVYMIKHLGDKLLIVTENQNNLRHGVDFVEIALNNGHQTRTTLGYSDSIKDTSDDDYWEYDERRLPLRHIKFSNDGGTEFTEIWNYDESNPIKYELKDSKGNIRAVRKETLKDGTDLRIDNILYDKNGYIKVNVSSSYDGADLKRFTYYNVEKTAESGSVFSEYKDG